MISPSLDFLIEIKSQKTLTSYGEKRLEIESKVQKAEGYRYIVQRQPHKWNVRAILDRNVYSWNEAELKAKLVNYGFKVVELYRNKSSRTYELYSNDMYAQLLSQENRVEMTVFAIETPEARLKIEKTLKIILTTLSE